MYVAYSFVVAAAVAVGIVLVAVFAMVQILFEQHYFVEKLVVTN